MDVHQILGVLHQMLHDLVGEVIELVLVLECMLQEFLFLSCLFSKCLFLLRELLDPPVQGRDGLISLDRLDEDIPSNDLTAFEISTDNLVDVLQDLECARPCVDHGEDLLHGVRLREMSIRVRRLGMLIIRTRDLRPSLSLGF